MRWILPLALLFTCTAVFSQPKSYSFVFLNKKTDADQLAKEDLDKIMAGHMANITRLAKEGKLIAAGPFEGGGGIFILNTSSTDEAKQWLETDPGVKANRWNVEIFRYTPHIRSACAVKEPYEMILYQFIRYKSEVATEGKFRENLIANLNKTGNIITEGSLGDSGEGIVVLKDNVEKEVLESNAGVKDGRVQLDLKQLYIAKGSFCE